MKQSSNSARKLSRKIVPTSENPVPWLRLNHMTIYDPYIKGNHCRRKPYLFCFCHLLVALVKCTNFNSQPIDFRPSEQWELKPFSFFPFFPFFLHIRIFLLSFVFPPFLSFLPFLFFFFFLISFFFLLSCIFLLSFLCLLSFLFFSFFSFSPSFPFLSSTELFFFWFALIRGNFLSLSYLPCVLHKLHLPCAMCHMDTCIRWQMPHHMALMPCALL